ncbi:unnamed protein product [Diatraea saccharalis]|uniref:Uncharacterized protein n=1 Tax=Diatraea saccharalis TaxID=40085 RepID=A0A9N9N052_9NEOP|nr:unnamed protein product [Diatraea saccharalis]
MKNRGFGLVVFLLQPIERNDNDSSDLDEFQMNFAAQMHNIVNDDNSTTDSNDETALFGSDYSDEDPTYEPDPKECSPKQMDSNSDFIPESPDVSFKPEALFMVLIDEVLDRVWISLEGGPFSRSLCSRFRFRKG